MNDWKAYHRKECPQLQNGKSKTDLNIVLDRMRTLNTPGQLRENVWFPIAPKDSGNVWRGDVMLLHAIHMKYFKVVEKTKGFPTGWHIKPRVSS